MGLYFFFGNKNLKGFLVSYYYLYLILSFVRNKLNFFLKMMWVRCSLVRVLYVKLDIGIVLDIIMNYELLLLIYFVSKW